MRDFLPSSAGANRAQIELREPSTAGDLVDALGAPRTLVFSLLIDGVHSRLDDSLHDGVEVTLMPPFAGG
jgi:sulfur-carrier protein